MPIRPYRKTGSKWKLLAPFALIVCIAAVAASQSCGNRSLRSTYDWKRPAGTEHARHPEPTQKHVMALLANVTDPELSLNIVELGLIYDLSVTGRHVDLVMTLTTPTCPFAAHMIDHVKAELFASHRVDSVTLRLSFDPPWTVLRLSPDIRERLFGSGAEPRGHIAPGGRIHTPDGTKEPS